MKIDNDAIIHHLHECRLGALGTHSQYAEGFPFVTALPFVLDEKHCPVFLISRLAEHTKNILADSRASFLVCKGNNTDVLAEGRITIVGEIKEFTADANLVARYCRYHPNASDYVQLGDFSFFRLEPKMLRVIIGFGAMGWCDALVLSTLASLGLAAEAKVIQEVTAEQPSHIRLLGLDRYGIDLEVSEKWERQKFPNAPIEASLLAQVVSRILHNL